MLMEFVKPLSKERRKNKKWKLKENKKHPYKSKRKVY